MNWRERIAFDPAILAGTPVIRGTRLGVDFVVGLLGQGWTEPDIQRNYPGVTHEDIAACLQPAVRYRDSPIGEGLSGCSCVTHAVLRG